MSTPEDRDVADFDDQTVIEAMFTAMYASYLRDDPAAIDAHLDDDVTLFDSHHQPLVRGKSGLSELRSARSATQSIMKDLSITVADLVIHHIPGTANARLVTFIQVIQMRNTLDGTSRAETVRNTAIVVSDDDSEPRRWRVRHLHEDVLAA